jgi:hypothetical protein
MKNIKKILFAFTAVIFLNSCGEDSVKVEPLKRGDKTLTCSEILLEVNEAEFYKEQAKEKQSLGITSIVMPLGYIDTYMSADEAVSAAQSRIDYLNRIFDIKNCSTTSAREALTDNSQVPVFQTNGNIQSQDLIPLQPLDYRRNPDGFYSER